MKRIILMATFINLATLSAYAHHGTELRGPALLNERSDATLILHQLRNNSGFPEVEKVLHDLKRTARPKIGQSVVALTDTTVEGDRTVFTVIVYKQSGLGMLSPLAVVKGDLIGGDEETLSTPGSITITLLN